MANADLDTSSSERLLHEARASSSLAHPNICTIYEVGENEGEFFIVMELVGGKSLRAMCAEAALPPESVLRYGVQIASALARAHDRGIVHRDLKTANIVVTADDLVKVLDFGLAKQVGSGIFDATTRSFASIQDASSMSGTLPYMAPEILRGETSEFLLAFGPLFNAVWPRSRYSAINAPVKFRLLWKRCSRRESFPPFPDPSWTHPRLWSCTVCGTLRLGRETSFCWWEQRRERLSFVPMPSAAVGRSGGLISTDTVFTLWHTTTAEANTAYGLPRRVIGEHSCDQVTTSERAGPIPSRPRFDFLPMPAFP